MSGTWITDKHIDFEVFGIIVLLSFYEMVLYRNGREGQTRLMSVWLLRIFLGEIETYVFPKPMEKRVITDRDEIYLLTVNKTLARFSVLRNLYVWEAYSVCNLVKENHLDEPEVTTFFMMGTSVQDLTDKEVLNLYLDLSRLKKQIN